MKSYKSPFRIPLSWAVAVTLATVMIAAMDFAQAYSPDNNPKIARSKRSMLLIKAPHHPSTPEGMTILFLGVDSNRRRTRFVGARSDAILLLTVKPRDKRLAITSIPRDSRVYIKGHGLRKINAAHACGGPKLSATTVSAAFGIPVNHYVVIDTAGLRQVCKLIGPLEVVVEKRMRYKDRAGRLHIDLKPGRQLLSPAQVEQYVRFRHDAASDIGRIQRQQWFIRQAFVKVCDPSFFWKLPRLLLIARDSIQTDLSLPEMIKIGTWVREIKASEIVTASLPGRCASIGRVSYWILDVDRSKAILNRINVREKPDSRNERNKNLRVAISYTVGCETNALCLEHSLKKLGYRIRRKRVLRVADCAHAQILLSSAIVRKTTINNLRSSIPMIASWPEVIAARPTGADLTFVIPRHESHREKNTRIPGKNSSRGNHEHQLRAN